MALLWILSPRKQIAKDAKECVQECVSEFISFITSEASERCHQEKRKTINGEDILFAMSTLGFDMYVEPLKLYLQKFREVWESAEHTHTHLLHNYIYTRTDTRTYTNSVFVFVTSYFTKYKGMHSLRHRWTVLSLEGRRFWHWISILWRLGSVSDLSSIQLAVDWSDCL